MTPGKDVWRPTASLKALRLRAEVLGTIRAFFAERAVLEVETPLLASAPVTDLHLQALSCRYRGPGADDGLDLFLQTSPEFAMKRLLAAGSGPIFQICKAFRDGEAGRRHNPEFTILEWYRPRWDHHRLMDEMDGLLAVVLGASPGERLSYGEAFARYADVDPHHDSDGELRSRVERLGVPSAGELGRNDLLDLVLTQVIEPKLGHCQPTFIHDYPASQAALARVRPGQPPLAERFEVFVEGLELANGYHELTDPTVQRQRFEADLEARRSVDLPEVPVDEHLLAALEHGMPECAGVAMGVDRLVMLAMGTREISEVLAFPIDRA
ncbi:MAG: EF-P lysine aminoacylase EpmA [Acidobacteriota bacterium]|nr:EF-P lysine aminoacylase EpmA [Acidobacteriota bacterium]